MTAAGLRTRAAELWLAVFFWHAAHAPWALRAFRPLILATARRSAASLRNGPRINAARALGPGSTERERERVARDVVGRFMDAVAEMGANRGRTAEQILARLGSVVGEARYRAARAQRRGAILATAHLGSFETSMAMLARVEPRVHVVFSRDRFGVFERLRAEQHARLGVLESPVEDGLAGWIRLRDALLADEVVLMQADRTMPGQPGSPVPFLDGHLRMPVGPVKLARLTGAPLVPVFAITQPRGRVDIIIEEPVDLGEPPRRARGGGAAPDPALIRLAAVIERYVRQYPDQWLCLQPALCEDQPSAAVEGPPG